MHGTGRWTWSHRADAGGVVVGDPQAREGVCEEGQAAPGGQLGGQAGGNAIRRPLACNTEDNFRALSKVGTGSRCVHESALVHCLP
jgi:hypothetical protein